MFVGKFTTNIRVGADNGGTEAGYSEPLPGSQAIFNNPLGLVLDSVGDLLRHQTFTDLRLRHRPSADELIIAEYLHRQSARALFSPLAARLART